MAETKTTTTQPVSIEMSGSGAMKGPRPWDDRAQSAEDRFKAYRDVLVQKADELLTIGQRPGISDEELIALAKDPENIRLKNELKRLLEETPE